MKHPKVQGAAPASTVRAKTKLRGRDVAKANAKAKRSTQTMALPASKHVQLSRDTPSNVKLEVGLKPSLSPESLPQSTLAAKGLVSKL